MSVGGWVFVGMGVLLGIGVADAKGVLVTRKVAVAGTPNGSVAVGISVGKAVADGCGLLVGRKVAVSWVSLVVSSTGRSVAGGGVGVGSGRTGAKK